MRIMHMDLCPQMRGGQLQALYLTQGLTERGVECALYARKGAPLLERGARELSMLSLRSEARRYDLVHAHDALAHTWALAAGRPLVVSRRVAFPVGRGLLSRYKYGRPARYLAVSQFVKRTLMDAGVDGERIDVVYDGVRLHPLRDRDPQLRVVALASKGRALLTEASRMAGIPIQFSDDIERDLPGAALFVYISDSEGLGSAALLAMAHGVPVVASNVGGLPEVATVLTNNDPSEIAAAITRVLGDPALARELGSTGRRKVEEHFTVDHMIDATIASYRKVLD